MVTTARGMLKRLQGKPFIEHLYDVLEENAPIFEQAQKDQLKAGKNKDGGYLPKYRDDPYFKNTEAALRYEDWKSDISPDTTKPRDVMDFWIDGTYNNSIEVDVKAVFMEIDGNQLFDDIGRKTGGKAYGLARETVLKIMEEKIMPEALKRYKQQLKLK